MDPACPAASLFALAAPQDYDGGDCCSCTCEGEDPTVCGNLKLFGGGGYDCQDPDAGCEDEDEGSVDRDTGCDDGGLGDGICDDVNNNENCGESSRSTWRCGNDFPLC